MTLLSRMLNVPKGITAFVGGGGKTSLIWRLGRELSQEARVIIATTTKIWPPDCATLLSPTMEDIRATFEQTSLLAIGDQTPEGKLAQTGIPTCALAALADYVLVEADGSRGLPLKAPGEREPVIPDGATLTVAVAGMSCAGQTIREAAHRPEIYAALVGQSETATVTPETVARVLIHPLGQYKDVNGRFAVVLNQADTPQRFAFARAVAQTLPAATVITALQTRPDMAEHWLYGKRVAACNVDEA